MKLRERMFAASAAGMMLAAAGSLPCNAADAPTQTPIKHVVVIFGENISFDHYFGPILAP